jgi:hypothetical protein
MAAPKPRAGVDEDAAGGDIGKGADSIHKVFAPRCHVLHGVQGSVGRRYFDVKHHDLAAAERADGVDEVLGLGTGVFAGMTEVISASGGQ